MISRLLALAKKPPGNPVSLHELERCARYELTLIDHDYAGRTPRMWNALHRQFGIDGTMAMMVGNPKDVASVLASLKQDPKYVGGGVGAGFKEAVIPHLDEVLPLAKAMGAVNIIKKTRDGRLVGNNTDGDGYAQSLEQMLMQLGRELRGAKILLLGAGGSGRAIAFALAERGARVSILNRTEEKAQELARDLNAYFKSDVAFGGGREFVEELIPLQDAVVSVIDDAQSPLDEYSTLGGMVVPVTPDSIQANQEQVELLLRSANPHLIVSDIRIRSEETAMLAQARTHGFSVLDGIPMVVNQGVVAFWWVYQSELEAKHVTQKDVEDVMWRVVRS